jgi:hypothetical protein
MSETPGGQWPTTPAGWYPTGDGQERWWDGNAWSQHHVRPQQQAPQQPPQPQPQQPGQEGQAWTQPGTGQPTYDQQPYQQAYQQPYAGAPTYLSQPASQGSSAARTVLIVIGVLMVLLVGGCVAVVATVGVTVDNVVDDVAEEMEADANAPGGSANPLTVTPGSAFEAQGFSYAAGWSLGADSFDDVEVLDLRVTNTGTETDSVFIDVELLRGTQALAEATCSSGRVAPGGTVPLTCFSVDDLPADYDTVTVADSF